jgi:hypothetical protein
MGMANLVLTAGSRADRTDGWTQGKTGRKHEIKHLVAGRKRNEWHQKRHRRWRVGRRFRLKDSRRQYGPHELNG